MKNNQATNRTALLDKIRTILKKDTISVSDKVTIEALLEQMGRDHNDLKQQTHDLGERVKELKCLYGLSRVMEKPETTIDDFMQKIIGLLGASLQYPEITCTRIHYRDKEYTSSNFNVTPWGLASKIYVNNKKRGELEVFYLTEKPEMDEGPFLNEERILINTIAKNLGNYFEKKESERYSAEVKRRLIKAQKIANMGDFIWNIESGTIFWSDTLYEMLGYNKNEIFDYTRINNEIHHPDDLEWVTNWLQECINSGKKEYEPMEYRLIRKNGEVIYVQTHVSVRYENGKPIELFGAVQDITKRKKTEFEHKKSQENLQITLNSIGDAVISTDVEGNILSMNPVAEKLTGWLYPDAKGKHLKRVFIIVNSKTGEKVENPVDKVIRNGKTVGLANHTKLIARDGKEYQISDSGAPIRNENGKITGVVLVFRDVTEEYRIQEELVANEKHYRAVFKNTGTATCIIEKDGTISLANEKFAELTGYPIKAIQNKKNWMEFVVPEDLERMQKQHRLRRKDEKAALKNYEFRFINKNNTLKNIFLTVDMIPGTDKSVASLLDITQRKKSEEALKESENQLKKAQKIGKTGSWQFNLSTGTAIISEQSSNIYGIRQSKEYQIKELKEIPLKKYRPMLDKAMSELVEGKSSYDVEFEIRRPSDDKIIEIHSVAEYNEKENIVTGIIQDITDRKKAEKELAHRRQLMQYIIENANSGVAIHNRDLKYIYVSKKYLEQYNVKEEDVIGKHHYEVFPDLPQKWRDVHQKALKGEVSRADRDPYKRMDGTTEWTRWECRPWYDENDEIGGIIVYTEIVTDLVMNEEKLRESEETYRNLFQNAQVGLFRSSIENGKVIESNDQMAIMFGFNDRQEFINNFIAADYYVDAGTREKMIRELKKNGEVRNFEARFYRRDGSVIWTQYSARINNEKGWLEGIIEDITEQKSATQALRESEIMYRSLIENSSDAIYLLFNRKFEIINSEFTRMFGYNLEEMNHPDFDFLQIVSPDSKPTIEERVKRINNGEKVSSRYEFTAITKSGEKIEVETSVSYIEFKGGWATQGIIRDVTQRKRAEKQLMESEARFRQIFDNVHNIAVQGYQKDYTVNYWNKASEKLYGYSMEEALGKKLTDLIIPDQMIPDVEKAIESMFNSEKPIPSEELKLKRKDGTLVPVYSNHTIINVLGKHKELYCIDIDLTERNKARSELEESNKFVNAVANSTPALIYIYDTNKNENVWTNEPHKKFFDKIRKNNEKLNFGDISELVHKDDFNLLVQKTEELNNKGNEDSFEIEIRLKNGNTWNWMSLRVSVFQKDKNGNPCQLIGAMFDIDKRKKAEEELVLLGQSVEQSPVSIAITNSNGEVIYVNRSFAEVTGYSSQEINGKNLRILKSGRHDKGLYKDLWDTIISGEDWKGELINKKKNGEFYWEDVSISPILDDKNEIKFFVSVREDISEKKKMIEDLTTAKEKAEESDRLKSAFLANMSHEIRTPMNGILGFADLLKEPRLTGAEKDQYVEIIQKSGKRMLDTINDLIDISKIESGTLEVNFSKVNINEQLDYFYNFFKPEAQRRGLQLICSKPSKDGDVIIETDNEKLNAALSNLIKNAIKYTNKGKIEFGCGKTENQQLRFFVKDTGIGIEKERQKSVFERFIQADTSLSKPYEGAGLGLSIAKGYIEKLGGKIWLESEIDKGSNFYFTIPCNEKNSEAVEEKLAGVTHPADEVLKKLTILIAEDEEVGRMYLTEILEEKCKKLLLAENGREAVELYKKHPEIDLVLMDIKMPVMDGYSASMKIKELNSDALIIAQTAYALAGDKEKALAAGCRDYLTKPLKKSSLEEVIQKYFG